MYNITKNIIEIHNNTSKEVQLQNIQTEVVQNNDIKGKYKKK